MFFFCPTFNVLSFSRANSLRSLDSGFRISLLGKNVTKKRIQKKSVFFVGGWKSIIWFIFKRSEFKRFGDGVERSEVDIWKFFYQLLSVDFVELVGHVEMVVFVDGVLVVFLFWNGLVAFTEV
jgi:hypothetical protein